MVGILNVILRFALLFHSECPSMRGFFLGMSAGVNRPMHSSSLD